ncbi:TetR/AcrR family transcriptional regulator [Pigmentiphaga aceris]|uniref:TetR/AcrR family transcriptional regulator n=1 Tax=Pigmentiphaga aceris TaxID=1940612 RepID=A0A5C0AZ02_9BURK|nr:TetR/AcrR family transcriptional regulator [Pigmentiphaga aceris]QEI07618.1 TetR/AcrR family transcriptional regulator [Pigmentiphaga aceris]
MNTIDLKTPGPSTRDRILDHAQKLIRLRGCNGFSYRDLADHVGVKTSSIHYYFPSKDDLLLEAVMAYSTRTLAALQAIDAKLPADEKLDRYVDMSVELSDGEEICLCGMLAADLASVPEQVAHEVQGFVQANESWLAKVLAEGRDAGTLHVRGDTETAGRALFASLQGSGVLCRLFKTNTRLRDIVGAMRIQPAVV